jgi:hypothetical protein
MARTEQIQLVLAESLTQPTLSPIIDTTRQLPPVDLEPERYYMYLANSSMLSRMVQVQYDVAKCVQYVLDRSTSLLLRSRSEYRSITSTLSSYATTRASFCGINLHASSARSSS